MSQTKFDKRIKIKDKWKQGDQARAAGYPLVLVIYQEGFKTNLAVSTVATACSGDLSIPMLFDQARGDVLVRDGLVFGKGSKTEPKGNSSLSAVATLLTFNPTLVPRSREWATIRDAMDPVDGLDNKAEQHLIVGQELDERMIREGSFDPNAEVTRLLVVHTRKPELALPIGLFEGPFDEEWAIDDHDGKPRRVHTGNMFGNVPGP